MINFSNKLNKTEVKKKINPIEIYEILDRKSVTGPLRPTQKKILEEWFEEKKEKKDLIIKLDTGNGKTLIGLLILLSNINDKKEPCLYVCPNIYLVNQVCEEAKKFGLPYCTIQEDNELPNEYLAGKSILIVHAQKFFNGKSIFGVGRSYSDVGTVILDDSHACIDVIDNSFKIDIMKKDSEELYNNFISLFEDSLTEQGEGTFLDIKNGEGNSLLPVPHWALEDKKSQVLKLLLENKHLKNIQFSWDLLKNHIDKCKIFVNGNKIEISPYYRPIHYFGSFHNAKHRILMSATTQNDSFFINGLNFEVEAIKTPLIDNHRQWSGEKMLLIPSLINEECEKSSIIAYFSKPRKKSFGVVALVPSNKMAKSYESNGAFKTNSSTIFSSISNLKSNSFENTLVIPNRYDGIDLPDESCRILIIDSLPYSENLCDRYEEYCRVNSNIINRKLAQKIEQGLGRSVRGEKDYSIALIIGSDLVKFIKGFKTQDLFSEQTKKQIKIGLDIAEFSKEERKSNEPPINSIISLIKQSLSRDESWKDYYNQEMNKKLENSEDFSILDTLKLESLAEKYFYNDNYDKAIETIQVLLDGLNDPYEKGWYLQKKSRYAYNLSKSDSNEYQKSAFKCNYQLIKPEDGVAYKKINFIDESRINRIKSFVSSYRNYKELTLAIDNILENLSFDMDSEKFESALNTTGEILGFKSDRPDKLIRKGPDNLWSIQPHEYIMFECKSEVKSSRKEIIKSEAGQMNSHCGWFEKEYESAKVTKILIIPTKALSYSANFTHDVKIMRKGKLREFKKNIKNFIKEFRSYNMETLSDEKIQSFIELHKLDVTNIKKNYCEDFIHLKK